MPCSASRYGTAMHGTAPDAIESTTADRIAYRPEEVAKKLGVSRRYVYTLIERGELDRVVLAGRWMILADELAAFVESLKAERPVAGDAA